MRNVESKMANMAVACACVVALSHVGYNTAVGSAGWWFVRMTRNGLCCMAVPFFFIVSGYFLSRHFDESGWWFHETGKRVRSLFVPYFLWCLAFFVFAQVGSAALRVAAGNGFWSMLRFPVGKLPLAFGLRLDATPMLVPLWYVRALLVIIVLAPAFAWFARRRRFAWSLLAALAVLYIVFSPHRNGLASTQTEHFLYYGISLMGMFYFYLGVMMRKTRFLDKTLGVPPWIGVALIAAGVALVVWRTGVMASAGDEPFQILCIAIPFLVAGTWLVVPALPWPASLTSMSFPIYVLHFFVVFALDGFHRPKADKSICLMLVQMALVIAVPCVITSVARRLVPRVSSALFGGR